MSLSLSGSDRITGQNGRTQGFFAARHRRPAARILVTREAYNRRFDPGLLEVVIEISDRAGNSTVWRETCENA